MKKKHFVIFYHFRQASNLSNALIVTENWHQSKFIFIQSTIHVFSIVNQINPTCTVKYSLLLDLIRGVLKLQKSPINPKCITKYLGNFFVIFMSTSLWNNLFLLFYVFFQNINALYLLLEATSSNLDLSSCDQIESTKL